MEKVQCVHCGQDWVRRYRRKDSGQVFFMCPECESLWLEEEDLHDETDLYLSEFLLTGDSAKDWEAIELCAGPTP
ncbi:hypothetical protein ACIBEA_24745 [Streptomyces sp. NPDC051555]|uniref:hypothetical protein n=1 Tax=Streptomyces sp. NPDC051555 TaxID=3365657 RepID=UPI0037992AA9